MVAEELAPFTTKEELLKEVAPVVGKVQQGATVTGVCTD
jgi:hypothetical protein